jgi:hypothetical protein
MGVLKQAAKALFGQGQQPARREDGMGPTPAPRELPPEYRLVDAGSPREGDPAAFPGYRGSGDGRGGLPMPAAAMHSRSLRNLYGPLESPGPSASGTPRGGQVYWISSELLVGACRGPPVQRLTRP